MTYNETLEILIVDDSHINKDLIDDAFAQQQISAVFDLTQSIPALLSKLEEKKWQQIILVIDNVPVSIDALIDAMPDINKQCPIIAMSEYYDRDTALSHIQSGATDAFALDETAHLAKRTKKLLSEHALNNDMQKQIHALQESHERCLTLNEQIPMPIAFIHEGVFINTNPEFQLFFGIEDTDEISDMSFLDFIDDKDINQVKRTLRETSNNGDASNITLDAINVKKSTDCLCAVNLLISPSRINGEASLQVIMQPVECNTATHSDTKSGTDTEQAPHSRFLNPEVFLQTLNQTIRNTNKKHAYSLSFFELDNYSRIKKNIGITRSDHLLRDISDFMSKQTSVAMKISRLNFDVYTLLVSADTTTECAKAITILQDAFNSQTFGSITHNMNVSSNIGIVHITDLIKTPEQALSLADVACTVSRNQKQNKPHIYNQDDDRSTVERVDHNWTDKIQDALKFDNFKLLFQPIVSLGSEHEKYYEVLLRIKSSTSNDSLPSQFLHFARESNLDRDIDKWVIAHAIEVLEQDEKNPICFFINLSENAIKDIGFCEWLKTHYSAQISNLVFEIPEDVAIKWQSETLHFIQQVHSHGGSVCIDQFSNHPDGKSQISTLNADFHKIDGAFISNLSTNRKHQSIIHTICLNAQKTDTKLIATYVQDADSLAILWREGVDFIQGNYLQAPASHLDYKFEAQI